MGLGTGELVLIFLVILLVFGAKRIPEIARGMGRGLREFKDATSGIKRELTMEEDRHPSRRVVSRDITPGQARHSAGPDDAGSISSSAGAETDVDSRPERVGRGNDAQRQAIDLNTDD